MTGDELIEVEQQLEKLELQLSSNNSYDALVEQLSTHINNLIANDFFRLIALLYRVDISEKKLQQLLQQSKTETSGKVIAEMIVERQLQKIEARKSFTQNNNIPEDEKW